MYHKGEIYQSRTNTETLKDINGDLLYYISATDSLDNQIRYITTFRCTSRKHGQKKKKKIRIGQRITWREREAIPYHNAN